MFQRTRGRGRMSRLSSLTLVQAASQRCPCCKVTQGDLLCVQSPSHAHHAQHTISKSLFLHPLAVTPCQRPELDSLSIWLCPNWQNLPEQEPLQTPAVNRPCLLALRFFLCSQGLSPWKASDSEVPQCGALCAAPEVGASLEREPGQGAWLVQLQSRQRSGGSAEGPPSWPDAVSQPQRPSQNQQLFPRKLQSQSRVHL